MNDQAEKKHIDIVIDSLLQEIGVRRQAGVPLAVTATTVFFESFDNLSEVELASLALAGYASVESEGGAWPRFGENAPSWPDWPQECPPNIQEMINRGISAKDFDPYMLTPKDNAVLALVGFWTIGGAHFMNADANN